MRPLSADGEARAWEYRLLAPMPLGVGTVCLAGRLVQASGGEIRINGAGVTGQGSARAAREQPDAMWATGSRGA
jgi:hypothetical protein